MSAEVNDSASNVYRLFVYMGQGSVVPRDVTHVRVHPSVRVIADGAFEGCHELVEVELCEGLEKIGYYAFFGCRSLQRITIPSSVRSIGISAFMGCEGLVEVELCEGLEKIGDHAFDGCISLKRITIPSSVRVIAAAFDGCDKLVEVELCEELEVIGFKAFHNCKSLKRIAIPSSVRSIGNLAFCGCHGLVDVELCEGLAEIGEEAFHDCKSLGLAVIGFKAFRNCKSLKRIIIPFSVRSIGSLAFWGCYELVEVELCEGLEEIGSGAFHNCKSLRNIAIPPACSVAGRVFDDASALKKAFSFDDSSTAIISEALKHRFDELPIHQICYSQPHHPPNDMLQLLKGAIGAVEQPNATGTKQDCLGMSPLHILVCSSKHDMGMYRFLIEAYPNNLITQDKWGDIPIFYSFWGNAPREVMQLMVESHNTYFPGHTLDWGRMIITLGESNAPDGIRNLLDTHQNHFPDQNINWEECAVKLASSRSASIEPFKLFLRLSVANRLDALGVERWQGKVENFINEFPANKNTREELARLLYSNLVSYEQLKEATWLLELALWKANIDAYRSPIHGQSGEGRSHFRINCGVQQILPIVVSFLSPKWESNPSDDDN